MMHNLGAGKPQFKRIAAEFEAWLEKKNLSQTEAGKRFGASQSTVSRVIRGEVDNSQLLNSLCTEAGIDVHKKDPAYSDALTAAINEVWDGTDQGARDIAQLLYDAVRVGKSVP